MERGGLYVLLYELQFFQDSGFKFTLRIARSNPPQVFTGLVSCVIISCVIYLSAALHDMIFVIVIT